MSAVKNIIPEIENINRFNVCESKKKFFGVLEKSVRFIERNQMCDVELWKKFVNQFRIFSDADFGWRGEYWGKMMRGACMVLDYTQDDLFYRIIESSVKDMLTTQDNFGRFSTYPIESEFNAWDLWGRKYVMLGFLYFLEICRNDNLADEIKTALCRHADYIIEHIGKENGKKEICKASGNWQGLNSCSILEPMIRLYIITGDRKYFDFGEYIISTGFTDVGNLIEMAFENEIAPHDYPVVKAYEMMSCFEGLLHYYRLTGNEKHKTALLNFGQRIIDGELSIIGCSGCTHELFDHTAVKQTQTDYEGIVQETCVTVTWMRLAQGLLELSGDVSYADAIEQSFYNSYLGAFNTERVPSSRFPRVNDLPQVMPFDSYSPLTADKRGREVGGYNVFSDGTFYGCCACIAAAGTGIMPRFSFLKSETGFVFNFYEKAQISTITPKGNNLTIKLNTEYPVAGNVECVLSLEKDEEFDLILRIPNWCDEATVSIKGESKKVLPGYETVRRTWKNGDTVTLRMNMNIKKIFPPAQAKNSDIFAAYKRGPLVLAADARIANPYSVIDIDCDRNNFADEKTVFCPEIPDAQICIELDNKNGEKVRLINYSSAGKTWNEESACAVWLYRDLTN